MKLFILFTRESERERRGRGREREQDRDRETERQRETERGTDVIHVKQCEYTLKPQCRRLVPRAPLF